MSKTSSIIALAGLPNVGKSTLLNCFVGQKIAITTPKIQTTRFNTRGILNLDDTQLVFIDTPGLFTPKRTLEKLITRSAWNGIHDADLICFLTDIHSYDKSTTTAFMQKIASLGKPCVAILNKIDKVKDKKALLPIIQNLQDVGVFLRIFLISALRGQNIKDVLAFFKENASQKEWLFAEDVITDKTERELAEEITREALYMSLSEELPYSIDVKTEYWQEQDDGSVKIHQVIYVLKESQKNILVGKKGEKIKEVGIKARSQIAAMLGKNTHLFLFVKVKSGWIEELANAS